ncbi:MAG TPA: response regulator [Kofleriaceae bacterium]
MLDPNAFSNRAILVVDDDPDTLALFGSAFEKLGADVRRAASAEAAVAAFADGWRADAVLCDLHLPGRDGYALREDIRRIAGEVPVIAISGSHPTIERERALAAGFAHYFSKPTKLKELLESTLDVIAAK